MLCWMDGLLPTCTIIFIITYPAQATANKQQAIDALASKYASEASNPDVLLRHAILLCHAMVRHAAASCHALLCDVMYAMLLRHACHAAATCMPCCCVMHAMAGPQSG